MLRFPVEFRRAVPWVLSAMAVMVMLLPSRIAAAQTMTLPAGYGAQVLRREWRAAFPYRPAFGSLCALAPLTCALIDRPFAFNAHLELIIRPNAPDGSTGVLLPFAVSVPLFGRAEVGLGSCYYYCVICLMSSRREGRKFYRIISDGSDAVILCGSLGWQGFCGQSQWQRLGTATGGPVSLLAGCEAAPLSLVPRFPWPPGAHRGVLVRTAGRAVRGTEPARTSRRAFQR